MLKCLSLLEIIVRLNRKTMWLGLVMVVAGIAAGEKLTATSSSDAVLDALHDRGTDLKDFTADVVLREIDNDTGLASSRTGKIAYQAKGTPGDARLHVVFTQKQEENANPRAEKIEYLLDNGWLIDRDYKRQTETKRQVLRPGQKVNLLKLGEGPFPLPIGQEKIEVYRQFDVSQSPLPPGDKNNLPHVTLTPKPGTDLAKRFATIDVWVDPATNMPTLIRTVDVNKTATRETELSNFHINESGAAIDPEFVLEKVDPNVWTVREEPFSE